MPLSLKTRFWRAVLRLMFKNQKLSIAELRANGVKNSKLLGAVPETVKVETVEADGIQAEWLTPHNANPAHAILFFHGGGYVTGSIADHRMMCGLLAEATNTKVLIPEYRLAPEHPFPAAVDDALKVYHWLLKQGFSSEKIIFAGDSAGGGLSLAAALALKEKSGSLPAAILCLSPWADLTLKGGSHATRAKAEVILKTETLREWALCYTDESNLSNPLVSPVFGDFQGFPPIFIQVGSDEVLLDDALMAAEKARSAGVNVSLNVWDGMWHVWQALGNLLPENKKTFEEIAQFVKYIFK
ncbi:MAG: alpha/beta hydrolase [Anaerolineales bacterium]|nr:alpha/beta hydrolase [Anaerolineales bacterium]